MKHVSFLAMLLFLSGAADSFSKPVYLDDQFELPAGFRIYRVAGGELTGGSYDIAFDGQGRLLVGDGEAVRRLRDEDGDGVYDGFDVIAEGLGGRGPQGLLVYGDRLYAVGGDGVQMFEGYEAGGKLRHVGRMGEPFNTGGDHTAHTILRGHDGYLYFVTGDGGGVSERTHITEADSPALYERAGTVFRISPDGARWECVSSGGRNAPNLGMNYLGDLFSWDSDMEWHVDLPWYRPLRLNHWVQGGDQGWQGVGAYPPYYVDALPSVMDTGRGSPTWGVFYEHEQFPEKYRDTFLVCDYRWKSATSGGYNRAGRLVAFSLRRRGAQWTSSMEVFLHPKPGAVDAAGKAIDFGLVDVDVAPDGSIFISDHNQGVWRVIYDPERKHVDKAAPVMTEPKPLPQTAEGLLRVALRMPQLGSEWSRLRVEEVRKRLGDGFGTQLETVALNSGRGVRERLRAVRLLASNFSDLDSAFINKLARDRTPELRGQAAWLAGLRGEQDVVAGLLTDSDPFVRRRAAEAMNRDSEAGGVASLVGALGDEDRLVQYASMTALAHRPLSAEWFELSEGSPARMIRVLVAAHLGRKELPEGVLRKTVLGLLSRTGLVRAEELDLLRVLGIYREALKGDEEVMKKVEEHVLSAFPGSDKDVRWEQVRLIGEYGIGAGFGPLLDHLEAEKDRVTQFHIAQAIARLESGWDEGEAKRLRSWFLATQEGWFAEPEGKGRQFPGFWETVLNEYAGKHQKLLAEDLDGLELGGQLGRIVLSGIAGGADGGATLMRVYGTVTDEAVRRRIIGILANARSAEVAAFLRREYAKATDDAMRSEILNSVSRMPREKLNQAMLVEGLGHPDGATVVNCGRALIGYRTEINRSMADNLMRQLVRKTALTPRLSTVLMGLSKVKPRPRFSERTDRGEIVEYWSGWYEDRFETPFVGGGEALELKPNEALHDFLMSDGVAGGVAARGEAVYVSAQCARCHGGAGSDAVLFGPDLAGVTRRLKRVELVEAIVYPSKTVAERFQGTEIELKEGEPLSGFITERSADSVTLALQDRVEKISTSNIESITPQELSLMPEGLLSGLSWEQIRDLVAYLEALGGGK